MLIEGAWRYNDQVPRQVRIGRLKIWDTTHVKGFYSFISPAAPQHPPHVIHRCLYF